jgi:hypothetical protein
VIQVELKTVDGRTIRGISYTQGGSLPTDPSLLVPQMSGGWAMGQFHIQTAMGWIQAPAADVHSIPSITALGLVSGQSA